MLAVCSAYSLSEDTFVDRRFRTTSYMRTYEPQFEHVLDSTQWREYNGPRLIADASRVRTKGCPRSKRLRNEMDDRANRGLRCGLCNGIGHNRRSCTQHQRG